MVRSVKVRRIVSSSECRDWNIVKMSKLNANDLEIHVKRMAYFSWGWKNNRCLDVVTAQGLVHGAAIAVGFTLQVPMRL